MTNSIRNKLPEFGRAGWGPGEPGSQVAGQLGHTVYFAVVEPLVRPTPGLADDFVFAGAEVVRWWLREELR